MSTVRESKNTYFFGVLTWEVFHKIIILLPREVVFKCKATALIWSWFM